VNAERPRKTLISVSEGALQNPSAFKPRSSALIPVFRTFGARQRYCEGVPDYGIAEASLAGNLAGFSLGIVISALLLVLTLRAVRLPGTPVANIGLAVCAMLWNVGGLICSFQHPESIIAEGAPPSIAMAIQFTGAALWPLPLLAIWRHMAVEKWQCSAWRYLQVLASILAIVVATGVWIGTAGWHVPVAGLKQTAAYGSTFLLLSAASLLLRGKPASRALVFSMTLVFAGLLLTTLSIIVGSNVSRTLWVQCIVGVTGHQSLLLVVIGTFFLFARFRFADVLIHYSVRLFLACLCAATLVLLISTPAVRNFTVDGGFPMAGRFIAAAAMATGILMLFPRLDRALGKFVDRTLFHAPDYREEARKLGEAVSGLFSEDDVMAAAVSAIRATLSVKEVRSIPLSSLASECPPEIHEGHVVEAECESHLPQLLGMPDVELLVPVRAAGTVAAVLAIAPGPARRSLVSHEVNYLQSVATQLGTRLDLLRLEREMADRRNREAVLQRQVTEAELRALRAQINPHFLFNSLNTVANLIATDPPRAEVMVLRLARVFRHVLANSSRQMVPVREEMEFLRTYLDIEEARFGSRLLVEFNVAPEVASSPVPSLILQPVVENALRHGLGPRPGPGKLKISATSQGDLVCLAVEDDGVGPGAWNHQSDADRTGGVGLRNIVQRLTALYRDGAQLTIQAAIPKGTRVTLLVPRVAIGDIA
jgi:two-component system LytT family sensor kinase